MSVRLSGCPSVYPYAGLGVTSTSSCSSSSLCVSHICLVWDLQQLRRMTMTEVCACKKLVASGGRGRGRQGVVARVLCRLPQQAVFQFIATPFCLLAKFTAAAQLNAQLFVVTLSPPLSHSLSLSVRCALSLMTIINAPAGSSFIFPNYHI